MVVVAGGNAEVRGNALGIACAVGSMLIFTTYYLINRRVRFTHNMDPIEWITGIMVFAALAITPVALLTSSPDDYRQVGGMDWLYLAFVGGVIGIVGHTMMSWAHKFIPASRSSLYLLGMNVVAVSAAWPLHDEPVTLVQVLGGRHRARVAGRGGQPSGQRPGHPRPPAGRAGPRRDPGPHLRLTRGSAVPAPD